MVKVLLGILTQLVVSLLSRSDPQTELWATGVLVVLVVVAAALQPQLKKWKERRIFPPEVRWLLVRLYEANEPLLYSKGFWGQSFEADGMILMDDQDARQIDEAGMRARVKRMENALGVLDEHHLLEHWTTPQGAKRWGVTQPGRVKAREFAPGVNLADNPFE